MHAYTASQFAEFLSSMPDTTTIHSVDGGASLTLFGSVVDAAQTGPPPLPSALVCSHTGDVVAQRRDMRNASIVSRSTEGMTPDHEVHNSDVHSPESRKDSDIPSEQHVRQALDETGGNADPRATKQGPDKPSTNR